jgi:drug/metabolite transporter (DMT)-like permease
MFCLNLSLLCQVLSAGFGKQAAISMHNFSPVSVLSNHFYFFSMLCLGLQSIVWPIALRRYSLSFAYFYMTGSYVATILMSYYLFHEQVTPFNLAGCALIIIGVLIMINGRNQPQQLCRE